MIRTVLAATIVACGVSAVIAQGDPIAARKALMKENGKAAQQGTKFMKGEEPFDLAKAQAIFANYIDTSAKMPELFPPNSKTGGETTAAPKIWEDMAGFKAGFAKLSTEAKAAQTSVKDLDSFKAAFVGLTKNCGGCHETYRVKKS